MRTAEGYTITTPASSTASPQRRPSTDCQIVALPGRDRDEASDTHVEKIRRILADATPKRGSGMPLPAELLARTRQDAACVAGLSWAIRQIIATDVGGNLPGDARRNLDTLLGTLAERSAAIAQALV